MALFITYLKEKMLIVVVNWTSVSNKTSFNNLLIYSNLLRCSFPIPLEDLPINFQKKLIMKMKDQSIIMVIK